MPHTAFIGLGSNLEDPGGQLQRAFADLDALPDTRLVARSSLYRSAPVGYLDQPDFVNAVARLETGLTPQDLLKSLLNIEYVHGRERTFRNAPRTLDLDLLLYGSGRIASARLQVPHARMAQRAFVLVPLAEIAPHLVSSDQLQAVAGQTLTRLPPR